MLEQVKEGASLVLVLCATAVVISLTATAMAFILTGAISSVKRSVERQKLLRDEYARQFLAKTKKEQDDG